MKLQTRRAAVREVRWGKKDLKKAEKVFAYVVARKCAAAEKQDSKQGSADFGGVERDLLEKLFYFIDFDFYERNHKQIMGLNWIKEPSGPVSPQFEKIAKKLIRDGVVIEARADAGKITYQIADREKLPTLPKEEILEIEEILKRLKKYPDSESLSKFSHQDIPWCGAEMKEGIQFDGVFYRSDFMSARKFDIEAARGEIFSVK